MGLIIFIAVIVILCVIGNYYDKKKPKTYERPMSAQEWLMKEAEKHGATVIVIGSAPDNTTYPPLNSEAGALRDELIRIGRCENHSDKFDFRGYPLRSSWLLGKAKARAREIGAQLNELGGNDLMLQVHGEVARELKGHSGRELELAWDGIGEWQG